MIRGMKHLSYDNRLRELELIDWKRDSSENLRAAFQYLKRAKKRDEEGIL